MAEMYDPYLCAIYIFWSAGLFLHLCHYDTEGLILAAASLCRGRRLCRVADAENSETCVRRHERRNGEAL
jgi:hypothetical protein